MPRPGEPPARKLAPIIGRYAALGRLRGLVDPISQSGQVLLVIGEAGIGKTALLTDAAERARSAGARVLSVTGRESESRPAFAGLHQLLRPVLASAASLPARQAQALLGAFGLTAAPGTAGPTSRPRPACRPASGRRRPNSPPAWARWTSRRLSDREQLCVAPAQVKHGG
jgi:hypothetical protein